MGISIAIIFTLITAILFIAFRKGHIDNPTINTLTQVFTVIAGAAAIVMFVFVLPTPSPTPTTEKAPLVGSTSYQTSIQPTLRPSDPTYTPYPTYTPFPNWTTTPNWTNTPEITITPSIYFYYEKAVACYMNNDFDCTILYCTQVINSKPDYANAYFKRGDAYDEIGKYESAIIDYTKAIDLRYEPLNTAYHYRGTTYMKLKEYALAIPDFDISISIKPSAVAYANRSQTYYYLKNYEQAIADANEAIKINPSLSDSYLVRGTVYRNMGLTKDAIADFKMIITLNNNSIVKALAEQRLMDMGVSLP